MSLVNGFLDYLSEYYHHPQINSAFVREWTRVGLTLTKSDEYTENWRNRTWAGVIPTALIVCLILVIPLVANFIKYYKYKAAWFASKGKPVLGDMVDSNGNEAPQLSAMLNLDGNTTDLINANMSQHMTSPL